MGENCSRVPQTHLALPKIDKIDTTNCFALYMDELELGVRVNRYNVSVTARVRDRLGFSIRARTQMYHMFNPNPNIFRSTLNLIINPNLTLTLTLKF